MEQYKSATTIREQPRMLCPVCQYTEDIQFELTVPYPNRHDLRVSFRNYCPNCAQLKRPVEMYRVDPGMTAPLQQLNKAGIVTRSHCAIMHGGHGLKAPMRYWENGTYLGGPYILAVIKNSEIVNLMMDDAEAFNQVEPTRHIVVCNYGDHLRKLNATLVAGDEYFRLADEATLITTLVDGADDKDVLIAMTDFANFIEFFTNDLIKSGLKDYDAKRRMRYSTRPIYAEMYKAILKKDAATTEEEYGN